MVEAAQAGAELDVFKEGHDWFSTLPGGQASHRNRWMTLEAQ